MTDPDHRVAAGVPSLRGALEAVLLVVDEPVPEVVLAQVLDRPQHEVTAALCELAADYDRAGRGFELRQVAGGWRLYTRDTYAEVVERFVVDGQQARLTQAALEALAIVAYRQPVNRARVSAVRGVNSDGVLRTLVARGLVEEAGVEADTGAVLFRTTSTFLEKLGLTSVADLPPLAPLLPEVGPQAVELDDLRGWRAPGRRASAPTGGPAQDGGVGRDHGGRHDGGEPDGAPDGEEVHP